MVCRAVLIQPIHAHLAHLHEGFCALVKDEPVVIKMWQCAGEKALQDHFCGDVPMTANVVVLKNVTEGNDAAKAASAADVAYLMRPTLSSWVISCCGQTAADVSAAHLAFQHVGSMTLAACEFACALCPCLRL